MKRKETSDGMILEKREKIYICMGVSDSKFRLYFAHQIFLKKYIYIKLLTDNF